MGDHPINSTDSVHSEISASVDGKKGSTDYRIDKINQVLIGIVAVLVVGFVSLLVTVAGLAFAYMQNTQSSYRESRDATEMQNEKIDQQNKKLQTIIDGKKQPVADTKTTQP